MPDNTFGKAPIKQEGTTVRYDNDGVALASVSHPGDAMSYWPGVARSIRVHRLLEELDEAARQDLWWEIPSEAAAELALLIRDLMDG